MWQPSHIISHMLSRDVLVELVPYNGLQLPSCDLCASSIIERLPHLALHRAKDVFDRAVEVVTVGGERQLGDLNIQVDGLIFLTGVVGVVQGGDGGSHLVLGVVV